MLLSLKRLLKPYHGAAGFNTLLAPARFVDEHCFLTKLGHVGLVLGFTGTDGDCLTESTLQSLSARLLAALSAFDHDFRIYQFELKRRGTNLPGQSERNRFLEDRGLYAVDHYIALMYEPKAFGHKQDNSLSNRKVMRILTRDLIRNSARLRRFAESFVTETREILKARILSKQEAFSFLRRLVNLEPGCANAPLIHDDHLDFFLPDQHLSVQSDGLQIGGNHLAILSLKDAPKKTTPNFFQELCQIPANFIIATEYKPLAAHEAAKRIRSAEGHFHSFIRTLKDLLGLAIHKGDKTKMVTDKAAQENVGELGQLAIALNGGDALGAFSTTVVFYGPDKAELRYAISDAIKAFGKYEAIVFEETYNALNAFLGIIPGGIGFNMRRLWMLRSNYADMALAFASGQGEQHNEFLKREFLLAVETEDGKPYFMNLHTQDVLGVLVTGKTGSGKTVLCNTLLYSLQAYGPHTLILDVGHGYKKLCTQQGGSYMSLGNLDFKVNPFSIPASENTTRFLAGFLRMLMTNEGYHVSYADQPAILDGIGELYTRPEDQRCLSNIPLPPRLREPLFRWLGKGEYGGLFDNVEDAFTLPRFKVVDFQGIDETPEVAEPIFFYLFLRHQRLVQNPALRGDLKILWVDEAHKFLANETCRKYFVLAGKTYRKHLGGIGLCTQSAFDLHNLGMMEVLSEIAPLKILLANQSADLAAYARMFHLNEKEVERFRGLIPKQQFMLKREESPAQILNLTLSSRELEQYANPPVLVGESK